MACSRVPFGTLPDGRTVELYTLSRGDLAVSVMTYGAVITSLRYRGIDTVLGQTSLEGYLPEYGAMGVTVGRFANRIAGGTFELNGVTYDIGRNEKGINHLHGGTVGFSKRLWEAVSVDGDALTLRLLSPDGDMGYPGTVTVELTVSLDGADGVALAYRAETDRDTLINLTNHSYFNLDGTSEHAVEDTVLQLFSERFLEINAQLIPTGRRLPVADTPLDFRTPKPIGRDLGAECEQLKLAGGYDHCFVLGEDGALRSAARAVSARSGIGLECLTTEPGVQLYTANFLDCPTGKNGAMHPHAGFCLETQHFPDSPHHPDFPSTVLHPGTPFTSRTVYRFFNV